MLSLSILHGEMNCQNILGISFALGVLQFDSSWMDTPTWLLLSRMAMYDDVCMMMTMNDDDGG